MNKELEELLSKPTADIPTVGRICFGLSRNGSYAAARRGEIKTISVGRLKRALTAPLKRQLGLDKDS
jgi:hypothetical protein